MARTLRLSLWLSAYAPPLIWAGVIFFFSSQAVLPGFDLSTLDFVFKKCAHMFVYGVLYFLIWRGQAMLYQETPTDHWKRWAVPFFVCLLYAASDEFHQSFIGGRTATYRDIGYDLLGASIVFSKLYQFI